MKTKLEIIEETVAYYSEDPIRRRASDGGKCQYYISKGQRTCAVGRCLADPKTFKGDSSDAHSLFERNGYDILKKKYMVRDCNFWARLQSLHDYDGYWDESGLTQAGREKVELLKKSYIK